MSCNDTSCYDCNPCNESNPCYDNCGCLNPTTFVCITKPGTYATLGITNDMTGDQVLNAINIKASYPYQKMTEAQRLALVISSSTIGLHVYQTNEDEGVWVYKSTGWVQAY